MNNYVTSHANDVHFTMAHMQITSICQLRCIKSM